MADAKSVLGDFVTLQRGKTYSGTLVGLPGPVLLGLGSIEPGGGFRSEKFKTFGGDCPESLTLYPGDIYASLKGATKDGSMVGSVARVPSTIAKGRLTQDTVKLIFRSSDEEQMRHIYWVLRTPECRAYCAGHATGSAQVGLSRESFLAFPIPSLNVVRSRLTQLFDHIDDKIALNGRTNRLLSDMARAIFKAWFIDFEPVKVKAAGAASFPGMPASTFNRLPSSFVHFEHGKIPKDWEFGRLGDYCSINELTLRHGDLPDEIQYIDISSVSVGKLDTVQMLKSVDAPGRARRQVRHGDTIWSCVRPNRRSFLFIHSPSKHCIASTGFAVLSPRIFGPSYLYQLTTRQDFVDFLVANATGSAYPAVLPEHFASFPVVVPPEDVRVAFEQLTMSYLDLVALNERESALLRSIRDTLLPKLISGELGVFTSDGVNDAR